MSHSFEVVDSEILVEAPIIALRRDHIRMPDGEVAAREIVEHFGAVAVVAADAQGRLCLLRQWRQAAGARLVELPAGLLDVADEDPLTAAQRELVEEAGLEAASWELLIDMYTSPGFAEEAVRIYLARDLTEVPRPSAHGEEADITASWVPVAEALAEVMCGGVTNAIAVAGITTAAQVLLHGASARSAEQEFVLRPQALASRRVAALHAAAAGADGGAGGADGGAGSAGGVDGVAGVAESAAGLDLKQVPEGE